MRFGLIHRILIDTLAALGLLALIAGGELASFFTVGLLCGLAGAIAMPESWRDAPWLRYLSTYLPVLLLAMQVWRWATGGPFLALAVEFAAALQVVRLATRRGAAHDQQIVVLAMLHLVAGTVMGGGLAFGGAFLGFVLVAPAALVLSHLRREVEGNYRQGARDRTGLPVDVPRILRSRRVVGKGFLLFVCSLSLPIFLFTAGLFVLFPRVGLSFLLLSHSRPERMVGFSDRVDLGGVGKLRSDPTIAARLHPEPMPADPPAKLDIYLRGTAFDQYDGRTWSRSQRGRAPLRTRSHVLNLERAPDPEHDPSLLVTLEAIDPPVVFIPSGSVALRFDEGSGGPFRPSTSLWRGPEGEIRYTNVDDRGIKYRAYISQRGIPPSAPLPLLERQRYLTLPAGVGARTTALARRWVGAEADPERQARSIERRLRSDYTYDLNSTSGSAANPLEDFLFETKRGHCEFYSTAMAVMLRALGIPSRNVTGFVGATFNRFGDYYAVRQGDAHSWVEAYLPSSGWKRFDPTPPSQTRPRSDVQGILATLRDLIEATSQRYDRHVVGYDLHQQYSLMRQFRAGLRGLSKGHPWLRNLTSPSRRWWALLGLVLIVAGIAWLRRVAPTGLKRPPGARDGGQQEDLRRSVQLYEVLEVSLRARALGRPLGTPPRSHALALRDMGHPLGVAIHEVTEAYLASRFGGVPLTEEDFKQWLVVAKGIRDPKRDPAPREGRETAA